MHRTHGKVPATAIPLQNKSSGHRHLLQKSKILIPYTARKFQIVEKFHFGKNYAQS